MYVVFLDKAPDGVALALVLSSAFCPNFVVLVLHVDAFIFRCERPAHPLQKGGRATGVILNWQTNRSKI